ncbi:endophilin-A1-like isoform X2 [Antedon mediterranea]|uniref:endophilin-A1-like isoform X2 n=1 Tax=Antedon mediterranea TaxID=105859 RepID=UPI003AF8D3B5
MSFSGLKKQINKANQYMSEKIGGAEKTKMDEDFIELEKKIEQTESAVDDLMAKTSDFLQPNPAARIKLQMRAKGSRYPQVETALGETMIKGGTELGEDSSFGQALNDCGEAMKQLGDVKDHLDLQVRTNFIDPLNHLKTKDLKEVNYHRKKVDSRRLDFDFKKKKQAKGVFGMLGTISSEGSNLPEEEVRTAEEKFEESLRLAEDGMRHVIENDVEQVAQLDAFVQALLEYHTQSIEILDNLKDSLSNRKTEAENRPRMDRKPLRASKNSYNNDLNGATKEESQPDSRYTAAPSQAPPSVSSQCCRALYDFEPENEGELGFHEGDIITVTSEIDDNWIEGELDGRSGFFPRNYIEMINL